MHKLFSIVKALASGAVICILIKILSGDFGLAELAIGIAVAIVAYAQSEGMDLGTSKDWRDIGDDASMIGASRKEQAVYNQIKKKK